MVGSRNESTIHGRAMARCRWKRRSQQGAQFALFRRTERMFWKDTSSESTRLSVTNLVTKTPKSKHSTETSSCLAARASTVHLSSESSILLWQNPGGTKRIQAGRDDHDPPSPRLCSGAVMGFTRGSRGNVHPKQSVI